MQSFFTISSLLFMLAGLPYHVSSQAAYSSGSGSAIVTVTVTVTAAASSTINTNTCACPATSTTGSSAHPSSSVSSVLSSSSSVFSSAAASSSTSSTTGYSSAAASSSTVLSSANPTSSSSYSSTLVSRTSSSLSSSSSSSSIYSSTSSSPTPSPTLGIVQSAGGYSYVGCYTEPANVRALPLVLYANDELTVEDCSNYCAGYSYFGVEYSRECWCGNAISAGSLSVPASQCNMLCDGNQLEYCGGSDRLNVYSLVSSKSTTSTPSPSATTAATVYPSLGCYSEATNSRALNSANDIDYSATGMTVEKCGTFCQGYTFFGVEYGGECYCGNALQPGSVSEPDSQCYIPCDGNPSEICGGPDRLNVYYYATAAPSTNCNNIGVQFAAFAENPQIVNTDGVYSQFDPTIYKTQPAELTGTTTAVSYGVYTFSEEYVSIYGSTSLFGSFYLVIDHRGYLFAQATGTYTFSTQSVDDLFLLWIGPNALSGWTRPNANLEGNLSNQQVTFTIDLVAGEYYPLRFMWVNGDGPGNFEFSITAPDGTIVLDADTVASPYIVQFSCDGTTAPAYPAWGSET